MHKTAVRTANGTQSLSTGKPNRFMPLMVKFRAWIQASVAT